MKKDKYSFSGWNFWIWLAGNMKSIKEITKVGAPLLMGWLATNNPAWAGFVGILGKFLLDTAEYWIKQRKL